MSTKAPGPHYIVRSVHSDCYLGVDDDGDAFWYADFHMGKRFPSEQKARRWADDNVTSHSGSDLIVEPHTVH